MWPARPEMTRDECRKCLRCLELDAYGGMVSVLRAQGPFTGEKQRLLQELAKVLHISNERHRAEVRRAVNDEKLAMIAEQLNGPNTGTDWTIEGRRAIPLLPRLKARSAFATLANSLSLATIAANEKKFRTREATEEPKVGDNESHIELKTEQKLSTSTEYPTGETRLYEEKLSADEGSDYDKSTDTDNEISSYEMIEHRVFPEKRKSPSPLPAAPPNKVLVVSSSTPGTLNHGTAGRGGSSENVVQLSQATTTTTNSVPRQNVTVIPLGISCSGSLETADTVAQGNRNNHGFVQTGKYFVTTPATVCTTNATKAKARTTTAPSKPAAKVLLSGNVSVMATTDSGQETQDNASAKVPTHSVPRVQSSERPSSNSCNARRLAPVTTTGSSVKAATGKPIVTNSHRVMAVCPGTTVSSGPGPPRAKQTTALTCKKLPATLNHQTTAKMGVTLNSNRTVNISHHPNAKLASKANVILIQKGHTKGVTLSHAGKEVLGKVIMGGKNLCVTSQHNANSISVVPHRIAFNNGDQAVTMLSAPNSAHTDPVKANIKVVRSSQDTTGSTIVFNLRQDVLEKNNKVLSQILESSSVLTSEHKTVIQNASGRLSKEQTRSDFRTNDKDSVAKTDTVITSIKDEKQHRKSKDLYANANSRVNSIESGKYLGGKEILISSSQVANTQDDIISNIEIEDTICGSEIDVYDASLGSTDISLGNFQYMVEGTENHALRETRSPILSISNANEAHAES